MVSILLLVANVFTTLATKFGCSIVLFWVANVVETFATFFDCVTAQSVNPLAAFAAGFALQFFASLVIAKGLKIDHNKVNFGAEMLLMTYTIFQAIW